MKANTQGYRTEVLTEPSNDNPDPPGEAVKSRCRSKISIMIPDILSKVKNLLFPGWNLHTVHWTYFSIMFLLTGTILWGTSTPRASVSYIKALFLAISSFTGAGLAPLNLSTLNTAQQIILFCNMILGNPHVFGTAILNWMQRSYETNYAQTIERQNARLGSDISPAHSTIRLAISSTEDDQIKDSHGPGDGLKGARDQDNRDRAKTNEDALPPAVTRRNMKTSSWRTYPRSFPFRQKVGRNAAFHGLTRREKDMLCCVEYKAIKVLKWIVPIYMILWQSTAAVCLAWYYSHDKADVIRQNGVSPLWLGIFNAVSAFTNTGLSLMDLSMIPFQASVWQILVISALMIAGNTGFPIFLRFILWSVTKLLPHTKYYDDLRNTLKFTLKYPRRVYTHLFPSTATFILLGMILVLTSVDYAAFEVANRNNTTLVFPSLAIRQLDGLFQSFAMRATGFAIVPTGGLSLITQTVYLFMMYFNAYPLVMTMRSSNVFEERAMCNYVRDAESGVGRDLPLNRKNRWYYLKLQFQGQLLYDAYGLVVATFIIICVENSNYMDDKNTFSFFNIIFEICSGYSGVGLSIGLPLQAYSLCGAWHPFSQFVLSIVILRGRHRILADPVDRAVQRPSSLYGEREEEDEAERQPRHPVAPSVMEARNSLEIHGLLRSDGGGDEMKKD